MFGRVELRCSLCAPWIVSLVVCACIRFLVKFSEIVHTALMKVCICGHENSVMLSLCICFWRLLAVVSFSSLTQQLHFIRGHRPQGSVGVNMSHDPSGNMRCFSVLDRLMLNLISVTTVNVLIVFVYSSCSQTFAVFSL